MEAPRITEIDTSKISLRQITQPRYVDFFVVYPETQVTAAITTGKLESGESVEVVLWEDFDATKQPGEAGREMGSLLSYRPTIGWSRRGRESVDVAYYGPSVDMTTGQLRPESDSRIGRWVTLSEITKPH